MNSTRIPPFSREAESSVLGSILRDNDRFDDITGIISCDDFYIDAHRRIFQAIQSCLKKPKGKADLVLVADELKDDLINIGGIDCLTSVFNDTPVSAHATHYASIVKRYSNQRRLMIICSDLYREAENPADPDALIARAEKEIFQLSEENCRLIPRRSNDVFGKVVDRFEAYSEKRAVGLKTGFIDLDHILGGLAEGELIILAGRPGQGKSKLIGNILTNICQEQIPAYLFTLEMTNESVAERLACSLAKVSHFRLRTGVATPEEYKQAYNASFELMKLPLLWEDTSFLKPSEFISAVRRARRKHDVKLVVVDHLLLMGNDEKHRTQNDRIGEISRHLKAAAKECKIPIVALCQMNRQIDSRSDGIPRLSDLRDSGNIEQDADTVMFLYKDKEDEAGSSSTLMVAKQRNGPTMPIRLTDIKEHYRFHNYCSPY